MDDSKKRVFFGLQVKAPWPEHLPHGRILNPEDRHATLAFLGDVPYSPLFQNLKHFPSPSFKVGPAGIFTECLFLPPRHPNVVAWDVQWIGDSHEIVEFRQNLIEWLKQKNYHPKEHEGPWLCHVTLCRKPFEYSQWKKDFIPLPVIVNAIHLYESLGNLTYKPLWSFPLISPFQEIEHTADIAFNINGENPTQLYHHAQIALAFRYPALIPYMNDHQFVHLEDIIIALNEIIAKTDGAIGCPFKAISFHGQIKENNSTLQWEMIVDV